MNHATKLESDLCLPEALALRGHFALIDDDMAFSLIMNRYAQTMGVGLDCFGSLAEVEFISKLSQYQGAIVDFDLGSMNGVEIASYCEALFPANYPIILISGKERTFQRQKWPKSIRAFVHKNFGPETILNVMHAYSLDTIKESNHA